MKVRSKLVHAAICLAFIVPFAAIPLIVSAQEIPNQINPVPGGVTTGSTGATGATGATQAVTAVTSADAQCAGYVEVNPSAPPCQLDQKTKVINGYGCTCGQSVNGFSQSGICIAISKCQALSAGGLNGGNSLSTLSALGSILGSVLGRLLQTQTTPTATTGCTTSYYYTSNTALIGVDPCALYQAGTTCTDPTATNYNQPAACTYSTCTDPTATNYGASAACTYGTTSASGTSAQSLLSALNGSSGTPTSGVAELLAAPSSGTAPLSVTFTTNPLSSSGTYSVNPGNGNPPIPLPASSGCTSSSSASCVFGSTFTYSAAGTYTATLSDGTGATLATVSISVTNQGAPSLTVSPSSGTAPLAVTFATNSINGSETYSVDPGDGSGSLPLSPNGCTSNTSGTCVFGASYTYSTAGTYTATLSDGNGDTLATVSVPVLNPGASTGGGLTQVFNTVGGLLSGSSSTQSASSPDLPGVLGNILLDQNGATIFASTVNSANNSETSGFYGSDTLGSQPQSIAGQLCQGRPWASNVLADVIPPSFFDSLCQWGGYQVGQPVQAQPQVTLTQQTPAPAPAAPAATTTPTVSPQAIIYAVPSAVPLGARTSIFWNTQGVTQCTESSPDGSFTEDSLSGAAATVPLTGPTTFTISCLDPNGNPITDYVTVSISN